MDKPHNNNVRAEILYQFSLSLALFLCAACSDAWKLSLAEQASERIENYDEFTTSWVLRRGQKYIIIVRWTELSEWYAIWVCEANII